MLPTQIKALFKFVDFLHDNLSRFEQYSCVLSRAKELGEARLNLKPSENYNEKIKSREIQKQIDECIEIVDINVVKPIIEKATELNICDVSKPESTFWNYNFSAIIELKETFTKRDQAIILKKKEKYLSYRGRTRSNYFQDIFFGNLDEILNELFSFFDDRVVPPGELSNIEIKDSFTIPEKLDFWRDLIQKSYFIPIKELEETCQSQSQYLEQKDNLISKLFGPQSKLLSPLLIPEHIYNKHFPNSLSNPEFTYWFLKFHASEYAEILIDQLKLVEKLTSPMGNDFFASEMNKLEKFENTARSLLVDGGIDPFLNPVNQTFSDEIELLRILSNYYAENPMPDVHAAGQPTVRLYARHILLKYYMRNKFSEMSKPLQHEIETNGIEENDFLLSSIEDYLEEFKDKMPLDDYLRLVRALREYTTKGAFPTLQKSISISTKANKKRLGWQINQYLASQGLKISDDLLLFAHKNISIFASVRFNLESPRRSNLYKYFTTKV